ncbi:putative RNA methyltransferase [Candidatus Terasakiella magnetica]|uniref:Putative RNA methyltransferase n=1 Tax=Candidatus Terasakiella magnetica TaxID=1867952 RepID=A0A1C3RJB2_9PROT|nr:class I SAM-dependent RNA methyltransferase [Candidatus Terasakiella magnetica]SCA57345.1 putative RNA methyltransferase [Candidatus Terasakiella magnetica]
MPRPFSTRRRSRPNTTKTKKPSLPKELMEVSIYSVGAKGDGLGRDDTGHDFFVPYTVEGDVVKVRVTDKRQDAYIGEVKEIITPSTHRIEAPCPHYTKCGGCNLQHMDEHYYHEWKTHKVIDIIRRSGIIHEMEPAFFGKPSARRRASFAVMKKGKKIIFGFNARSSHRIEEIGNCLLLTPELNALITPLRELLPKIMKQEGRGDIIINFPLESSDIVFSLPGRLEFKAHEHLMAFVEKHNVGRVSWRENGRGEPDTIAQHCAVTTEFSGSSIELPPAPFLQPSKEGEQALVDFALSALNGEKKVLDLYAGCGSFTFALATKSIVHAVESNGAALKALELSAGRAGIGGRITTEVRDLDRQPLMGKELAKYDAVLFDPPRAGAREQAEALAESDIKLIIAISCNPATFGRDAAALLNGGYELEKIMPVDQFTWSDHVEVAAIFRRP